MKPKAGHQAFTIIELLVVIGILAVLAGILFIGLNAVDFSGREKQTRVTMESLKSMFAEYRIKVGFPVCAGTYGSTTVVLKDYNQLPASVATGAADRLHTVSALLPDSSRAVPLTQCMLARIAALVVNQKALDALPARQKFAETVISPADASVLPAPTAWAANTVYDIGAVVYLVVGGENYICLSYHTSDSSLLPTGSKSPWLKVDQSKPILKDAWDNPIIFVPVGLGLSGSTSQGVLVGGTAASNAQTIIAPDGRPFWASAGPDGDFSKGDDNIYSFEQ